MRHLAIIILSLLIGCVSPIGRVVKVCDGDPDKCFATGHGAIIGPHKVVTAYHVVDNSASKMEVQAHIARFYKHLKVKHWYPMEIEELILYPGNREPIAVLRIDGEKYLWCHDDIFTVGTGPPHIAITGRGKFLWSKYIPAKGDSGSPVVNKDGELVGVIWGGKIGIVGQGIMLRLDPEFLD